MIILHFEKAIVYQNDRRSDTKMCNTSIWCMHMSQNMDLFLLEETELRTRKADRTVGVTCDCL